LKEHGLTGRGKNQIRDELGKNIPPRLKPLVLADFSRAAKPLESPGFSPGGMLCLAIQSNAPLRN
jgi:hypothetical protein